MATRMTQSGVKEPHPGFDRLHQPQFVFKRIISSFQPLLMRLIGANLRDAARKRVDGVFL